MLFLHISNNIYIRSTYMSFYEARFLLSVSLLSYSCLLLHAKLKLGAFFPLIFCLSFSLYSVTPKAPGMCCWSSWSSNVKSCLQDQAHWRWIWWKRNKICIYCCCSFCTIVSFEETSENYFRQGYRHDDNWTTAQFPWEIQGAKFKII